jgi:hypothetical protein
MIDPKNKRIRKRRWPWVIGGIFLLIGLWQVAINPYLEEEKQLRRQLRETEKKFPSRQSSPIEGSSTYGAYMLDSQNRKIGTWYSSYMAGDTVNNLNKTVSFTLHHNWLLN